MRTPLRKATQKGRRQILNWVAEGLTRKEIAEKLDTSVASLQEHYWEEMRGAKAARATPTEVAPEPSAPKTVSFGGYQLKETRFVHSLAPPDNCPFPLDMLAKVAGHIVKYDLNGMPCSGRGQPLFGKKDLALAHGRRGFKGTDRESITTVSGVVRSSKQLDWDCSLPDWEDRFMAGKSLVPPTIKRQLNDELAQKAIAVFKTLRLADVPGQPTLEEAGGDWLFEIVGVIMGCYDPVTKRRMLSELFLLVPKKNMKTTGGALIMLLLLIYNERPNGEAIMTAPVHDVAEIAFKAIQGAIELDADLARIFEVQPHLKLITDLRNKATLAVMTFDPANLTGQKLFAALIDEVHVIAKNPKAASALRQIRGGMLPFPEAILIFITTQSEEAPVGVFASELTAARAIRDGKRPEAKVLPILYEFPEKIQKSEDQQWRNPALWPLVTPNLGHSISIDALINSLGDAQSKGEGELRAWASQHLNIEIGLALRSNGWVGAKEWLNSAHDPALADLRVLLERSEVVVAGIDGGGLSDLLGLAIVGREKLTGKWLGWTHAWAHPSVMLYHNAIAPVLDGMVKAGELTVVTRPEEDIEQLVGYIEQCETSGLLDKIGLDPYGVGGIVEALLAAEIPQERVVGISQGWRLGGAIKTLERALSDKKFVHANQKLLNWCVGNAQVELRGNASLITKAASGAAKIDALMALLDAVFLIASNPESRSGRYQMFVLGSRRGAQRKQAA